MKRLTSPDVKRPFILGLTLVEVLVAMTMLAVVAAAVFSSFATVSMLNRDAARDQEATVRARTYFEDLRVSWSTVDAFNLGVLPDAPTGCTVTPDPETPAGEIVRTVTLACDASPAPYVVVIGRPSP